MNTTLEQRLADALRQALAAYDSQQVGTHGAWRVEDYAVSNGESGVCIKDGDETVLDLPFMPALPESTQRARAARIVQCVNAHDGLVSALQGVLACGERYRPDMGRDWNHASYGDALDALESAGVRHA